MKRIANIPQRQHARCQAVSELPQAAERTAAPEPPPSREDAACRKDAKEGKTQTGRPFRDRAGQE